VGADLASLVREAALRCVRRTVAAAGAPESAAAAPRLTAADVGAALVTVRPSALREVAVEVPTTRWDDIGGYDDVKQRLREAIEWPLRVRP
jgi:AAA family ATPase